MKNIRSDIKTQAFKPIYLLFGEEGYLMNQLKNELIAAIVADNTMNLTIVNDKLDTEEIISVGETLPFLADKRLIVLDRCGVMKTEDARFLEFLDRIPQYLVLLICEDAVDKRKSIFKKAKANGYVCELKTLNEAGVSEFIKSKCEEEGKSIEPDAVREIYRRTCADLGLVYTELEKLISYAIERDTISMEDVKSLCSIRIEERVFDMIDFIAYKNKRKALELYYDLIALREAPMKILILMERHFNGLLQVSLSPPMPLGELAKSIGMKGVAPFVAGRYLKQAKAFSAKRLKEIVECFAETEESVKTGRMSDKTGVELMIAEALL